MIGPARVGVSVIPSDEREFVGCERVRRMLGWEEGRRLRVMGRLGGGAARERIRDQSAIACRM